MRHEGKLLPTEKFYLNGMKSQNSLKILFLRLLRSMHLQNIFNKFHNMLKIDVMFAISYSSSNEKATEFLHWQPNYFPSVTMDAQGHSKIAHPTEKFYTKSLILNYNMSPYSLPSLLPYSFSHGVLFISLIISSLLARLRSPVAVATLAF